ncbi:GntR family transcriptional regulator [Saccharopolyspora cebuensis]|uniref:GntR family transcriptional regulator n=1 Tax=Saccharopolyspora cebuensis TaxID=418759 RepID=A0ABV4CFG3_9PSEU
MAEPAAPLATKGDVAYDEVRKKILSGELPPGSVINQATLARTIGISTTPLREALRRLKSEGLVELGAHRDAKVTELKAEENRDLLEMRRSLDPMAASLAAQRRTKDDIAEIRASLAGLRAMPGNPDYEHLLHHRRYHRAIYRAAHNELLVEALEGLWDKADRYRRFALEVDRGPDARAKKDQEHQMLADAIIAGDSDGAAAVMTEHIDTSLAAQATRRLPR